jgi:GNAT superfamily N-acetyltransferase
MAPATASVATAAAVATPVATLPSQVAAAAARDFERLRNESGDLQMVKRLAWQLLAAGESGRSFALWAVGVMYSAAGERQVVAVSHHGAGYVPPGIAVPTELRMAWADPIINDAFRQRWTGNLDPAATLVAYAELKAGEAAAWRLGAAATTWAEVDALMAAAQRWGTEWATCTGMNMPGGIAKQALTVGAETTHRLAAEFPELAVQAAELKPRGLDHRAAKLITDALVSEARLVVVKTSTIPGESRLPANFDDVWPVAADSCVPAAERARFAEAVQQQWLGVGIAQPGWDFERSASIDAEYRGQWLISRALEAVLGWIADTGTDGKPAELPMADIVYAAAHAHLDGRGTDWITELFTQAERSRP